MSVWNIRGVSEDLARKVKVEAASRGVTLRDFVIRAVEGEINSLLIYRSDGFMGVISVLNAGRMVPMDREEIMQRLPREKGVGSKKIAEVSAGVVAQNVGVAPENALPPMGKAQVSLNMVEKRVLPDFKSEAEEAKWWFDNQDELLKDF